MEIVISFVLFMILVFLGMIGNRLDKVIDCLDQLVRK